MRPTEQELNDGRPATQSALCGLLASPRRNQVLRDRADFSILLSQGESPARICWAGGPEPRVLANGARSASVRAAPVQGEKPRMPTRSNRPTATGNPRIVVVDDEPWVRAFLKDLLTGKGYTVSVTSDARKGLRMLVEEKPDLVILALKNSNMDGLSLLRKMKAHDEMTPVIVTAHPGNMKSAKEGVRLGAHDYALKPLDPAYMSALTEDILEQWPLA